jgi:CRP-like cAMP-binding protein
VAQSVIFTYETMHPHGANPCFGEQALMYPAKRPVTITCISEIGVLWEIDRATYRRLLSSAPGDSLRKLLMAVPIFESLTMPQLNRLIGVLSEDSFEPGTTVFREGDVADTFYVCEGGHARVTRSVRRARRARRAHCHTTAHTLCRVSAHHAHAVRHSGC